MIVADSQATRSHELWIWLSWNSDSVESEALDFLKPVKHQRYKALLEAHSDRERKMHPLDMQAWAIVAGVCAHLVVSPLVEPSTIKILLTYFAANIALVSFLAAGAAQQSFFRLISSTVTSFLILNTIFLLTSTTLTLIRRAFFSPLSSIPGPRVATLSKLWAANEYRHGRAAKTYRRLHEEYNSDFVRIGPNEVSIRCAEAIEKVYRGKYQRGTFYEVSALTGAPTVNNWRGDYKIWSAWRRI